MSISPGDRPIRFPGSADRRFDLLLAELTLVLARWRGDLETALETRPLVEAALARAAGG